LKSIDIIDVKKITQYIKFEGCYNYRCRKEFSCTSLLRIITIIDVKKVIVQVPVLREMFCQSNHHVKS